MTKKSHLLKEIDLSKLGNPQQAKSIEDIRSSKKDQEVSAKKQAQPAQKNNQNQSQQPSEQVNLNQNTQQVSKQTKEPAQKKTTQKQEISDENFKDILSYLDNIDLNNPDENDKKLLNYISSNIKKFTNEQKVELKKNSTIQEYFLNNNTATKTAVEKNISSLIYEQDDYLMFYDDKISDVIKNKFDKGEGNLIKDDNEFKDFVKNISGNFKNIHSSQLIGQDPALNFLQDKIFLLIEDTTGKNYKPLFYCVSSNFTYDKKTKKLNFKVKIDIGATEDIQNEYSYAGNLKDEATFSYDIPEIKQTLEYISNDNFIYSSPLNLLRALFSKSQEKDNTVSDEIQKAQQEKDEENRQEIIRNQAEQEELKQNQKQDQEIKHQTETPEEKGKDILANTVYDRNLENNFENNLNDQNLNLFIADGHFKFKLMDEEKHPGKFSVIIKNTQNAKKTNFKKLYENLSLIIKTQIRNEFVNFYNRKDDEKIENMQNYFYSKIMSSKVGDYIKSIFGERNENSSPDLKILLLTDEEMKNISRGGNFVLGQNNDENQENQPGMSQDDFIGSFYNFQEDLFSKVIDKVLNDVKVNDWKYIYLDKQADIDKFKKDFKNNLMTGSSTSTDANDANNKDQKETESEVQEESKDDNLDDESQQIEEFKNNDNDIQNVVRILKIMLGETIEFDEKNDLENIIVKNLSMVLCNQIKDNNHYSQITDGSNSNLCKDLCVNNIPNIFTSKFNSRVFLEKITDKGELLFHYNLMNKIKNNEIDNLLKNENFSQVNKDDKIKSLQEFYQKGKTIRIKTGILKTEIIESQVIFEKIFSDLLLIDIARKLLQDHKISGIYTSKEVFYDATDIFSSYIDKKNNLNKTEDIVFKNMKKYPSDSSGEWPGSWINLNGFNYNKHENVIEGDIAVVKNNLINMFKGEKDEFYITQTAAGSNKHLQVNIKKLQEDYCPITCYFKFDIDYNYQKNKSQSQSILENFLNIWIYDIKLLNVKNLKVSLRNDKNYKDIKSYLKDNDKILEKQLKEKLFEKDGPQEEGRPKALPNLYKRIARVLEKEPKIGNAITNVFKKRDDVIYEYIINKFLYNEFINVANKLSFLIDKIYDFLFSLDVTDETDIDELFKKRFDEYGKKIETFARDVNYKEILEVNSSSSNSENNATAKEENISQDQNQNGYTAFSGTDEEKAQAKTEENFSILKIKGQKLILEETQKSQNENTHLDFSYFKSRKKEIQNLIKQYEKEEDSKSKSSIEKKIREKQREISNQITLQSIKNFVNNIKSLRNANNGNSQKLVKQMSKRLGFEPSPLEFGIQSLNKFKNMSEFSRVISNIILTNIMLQLTQLNTIYTIFSNDKIDENVIKDAFMQLENDFKRLVKSLQEKEVSSKFEELSEKISENFGTDSSVYLETKDTYEKVMSYYQKQYKSLTEFKKSLSDFWENYSKIEKEEEKINQRKNMISQFIEIRDSKEIKQIYKVYLVNNSFFNDKLKSIIDANSKLSYNEILTSHGYETFESIYQKEKQIFDKTFKKCNEVLGKSIGQGKLGKLFDDLEKIKTNLENTKPTQENKKEDNQEKSNETQNSQDKQKTELNKNIKPETENKQDKTEETSGNKTESKKIKQGLKLLNNNTELKIYQRKK